MSLASDIIDELISSHYFPGYTTRRNALTEGFKGSEQFGPDEYPVVQGFGVTTETTQLDFGGEVVNVTLSLMLVRNPDEGDQIHTDIEGFKIALEQRPGLAADYPWLVDRAFSPEDGADEVSDRNRTYAAIDVNAVRTS